MKIEITLEIEIIVPEKCDHAHESEILMSTFIQGGLDALNPQRKAIAKVVGCQSLQPHNIMKNQQFYQEGKA